MAIKKLLTAGLLVLASFTSSFTIGTVAAHATVSAPTSHTTLWWDGATCKAFSGYTAPGRFHAMVVDSRHADTYLRVDVAQWAHDARPPHPAPAEVQVQDNLNVAMDCHYTGGQGD